MKSTNKQLVLVQLVRLLMLVGLVNYVQSQQSIDKIVGKEDLYPNGDGTTVSFIAKDTETKTFIIRGEMVSPCAALVQKFTKFYSESGVAHNSGTKENQKHNLETYRRTMETTCNAMYAERSYLPLKRFCNRIAQRNKNSQKIGNQTQSLLQNTTKEEVEVNLTNNIKGKSFLGWSTDEYWLWESLYLQENRLVNLFAQIHFLFEMNDQFVGRFINIRNEESYWDIYNKVTPNFLLAIGVKNRDLLRLNEKGHPTSCNMIASEEWAGRAPVRCMFELTLKTPLTPPLNEIYRMNKGLRRFTSPNQEEVYVGPDESYRDTNYMFLRGFCLICDDFIDKEDEKYLNNYTDTRTNPTTRNDGKKTSHQ